MLCAPRYFIAYTEFIIIRATKILFYLYAIYLEIYILNFSSKANEFYMAFEYQSQFFGLLINFMELNLVLRTHRFFFSFYI